MRKIVLGLLALLMATGALVTAPRRANALTCPLQCPTGSHCCQTRNYVCLPNSIECP